MNTRNDHKNHKIPHNIRHREYIGNNLIPLLGNKRKLLHLISKAIRKTGIDSGVFCDIFAGSGSVSKLAKTLGFSVIANDWEDFSFVLNKAFIECNSIPPFKKLGGIKETLEILNSSKTEGIFTKYYAPEDDNTANPEKERMFYTHHNALRLDGMRQKLQEWDNKNLITKQEYYLLLGMLVYRAAYHSNTSGVFKAYHHGFGGRTRTALYRIKAKMKLSPPILFNSDKPVKVYRRDANELIKELKDIDILYLDPPYNQHQYGSNYHILNTVCDYREPDISEKPKRGEKVGIRPDWKRTRSGYCNSKAFSLLKDLIGTSPVKYILLSYSSHGLIDIDDILNKILKNYEVEVITEKGYERYSVSSTRPVYDLRTTEFVFSIKK